SGVSVMRCDRPPVSRDESAGTMIQQSTTHVRRKNFYPHSFKFIRRRSATVSIIILGHISKPTLTAITNLIAIFFCGDRSVHTSSNSSVVMLLIRACNGLVLLLFVASCRQGTHNSTEPILVFGKVRFCHSSLRRAGSPNNARSSTSVNPASGHPRKTDFSSSPCSTLASTTAPTRSLRRASSCRDRRDSRVRRRASDCLCCCLSR